MKGCDIVKLIYLSQEAVDNIKIDFRKYRKHFKDETNEWFVQHFEKNGWMQESKIQCDEFSLDMDEDYDISDRKNVEVVYEALRDLSPSLAADERLWSGMLFCQFWDYVKYRRRKEIKSGIDRDVLNSFFFLRGIKRSCFMNCLSRLWWTGYLLYDSSMSDHYRAVDLITETAFASNIVLFSSNNFASNKNLALGVLDCLYKRKQAGEKIGRYHFVEANKYINCIGGITLLDTMSREEVCALTNRRLDKIYGKLV